MNWKADDCIAFGICNQGGTPDNNFSREQVRGMVQQACAEIDADLQNANVAQSARFEQLKERVRRAGHPSPEYIRQVMLREASNGISARTLPAKVKKSW